MAILSAILRYLNLYDYDYREDLPIILSDFLEENPNVTQIEFSKFIDKLDYDFFYLNKINKNEFSKDLYEIFIKTKGKYKITSNFYEARNFIQKYFEIGLKTENREKSNEITSMFNKIQNPHNTLMQITNEILIKMKDTYQLDLHGVKEYSGVDIIKKYNEARIGFQIKSKNDDIGEDRIRSQTSKAIEQKLDAFILIYGRKSDKTVETSIQSAYHHFEAINKNQEIYCSLITPRIFAELIILYEIDFLKINQVKGRSLNSH